MRKRSLRDWFWSLVIILFSMWVGWRLNDLWHEFSCTVLELEAIV